MACLALRVHAAATLPLSGDEAYHWEWSRHLAGAYYDHPGMTAWLIRLAETAFPPGTELAVRLPALVSLTLAAGCAAGLARDVARHTGTPDRAAHAAWLAAALVFFAPLPAVMSVYMSTDPPLQPIWLAAVWAGFRALAFGRTSAWLVCGACLGLAASTKLLSVGLIGALGLFMVGTRDGRRWLARPQPYLALLAMLAMAAPMLAWNASHDWMTFRFNFAIRQREQQASALHPLVFVASQLGVFTPGFAVLGLLAVRWAARQRDLAVRAVAWSTLLVLLGFLAISLRRRIGVHWPAPAWLVALSLLAVVVAVRVPFTQTRAARLSWTSSWWLSHAALSLAYLYVLFPGPLGRLELIDRQPRRILSAVHGWDEVGATIARVLAEMTTASGLPPFVISDQYGMSAAMAFYTPGQPPVHLWSAQRNHGRNYQYWDDWAALRGRDAVFVKKRPLEDWEVNLLRERFVAVGAVEPVPIRFAGEVARSFYLVRCRGFDGAQPFPASD